MNPFEGHIEPQGYRDLNPLYKNDKHELFKAVREQDNIEVVLKLSRTEQGHIHEVSKLAHEYEILQSLDHPGIPKVYDLLHSTDSVTLVQEFFEGSTLSEMLFKGRVEYDVLFNIAIQLADILSFLHENGIVHKDINSSNVIVSDEGLVKLIDFGISTNIHFEQNESVLIEHIEGTLTNIAPEQTGRTAYSITHSCDLYSFGILIYEIITGKPPFDSADPLEIIHFHLSRKASPLSNLRNDLPYGLDQLVNKLLEKNPDDRYKSSRGVKIDLEALYEFHKTGEDPSDFKICQQDRIDHYKQTQKLYGRDAEIEELLGFYKQLYEGESMLALVGGYSGVGKSALISNVKYPIIQDRGVFITGKFDQFKKNIPFYAFIEAFKEFIKTLLSESEEEIAIWKDRLNFILGKNGALITEVIPQLSKIIGKQPEAPKLQPAEQETRFNMVLLDFVYAFSSQARPLVIFLDDLQWADLSSLNLIRMILSNSKKDSIMLLGAYRSNEVDKNHALMLTLDELSATQANVRYIELMPLTQETTSHIIADSFGMDQDQSKTLGKLVYAKTKGNPFFINRFLKSIYDSAMIHKEDDGLWQWDENSINALEYTDNVVDLMIQDLVNLPSDTQNIIKLAAVLGNTFGLQDLAIISGHEISNLFKALKPALKQGYLQAKDKRYRSLSLSSMAKGSKVQALASASDAQFGFTHDKVQQAAYALISEFELERIHLETGRLLLSNISEEELNEDVFELLNHFAISIDKLDEEDERIRIAELCLMAGVKAKDSTSYALGVQYLNMGRSLLGKQSWNRKYDLTFNILSELGECEHLNNNSTRAEQLFNEVLEQSRTNFEKLKVYYVHSSLYLKKGDTSESLRIGLEAVKLYNVRFPKHPKLIQVKAMLQLLKYLFLFSTKYKNPKSLFNLKDCDDEEIIMLNKFLIDLATSAYQQDQNLMMLVIFKILKSYLRNGFTDASGWGFSGLSVVVLSVIKMQKRGFNLWDVTTRLHQRTHSPLIKWRLGYTVNSFYNIWRHPIRDYFDDNMDIVKACIHNGDQIFTGYTLSMHLRMRWFAGTSLKTLHEDGISQLEMLENNPGGIDFYTGHNQLVKSLSGLTSDGDWDDDHFSGQETASRFEKEGNKTKMAFFVYAKIPMLYFYGHHREAVELADEHQVLLENIPGDVLMVEYAFYRSLAIAANYQNFNSHEKKKYLKIFKKHLKEIKFWAKGCQYNFSQHLELLNAELKAIEDDVEQALQLYEKAMSIAAKNGFVHIEAIANERAAVYSLEHRFEKQGKIYLQDTWQKYHEWGAKGKCKQLEFSHPSLLKHPAAKAVSHAHPMTRTSLSSTVAMDLATVLKASQSIARQVKYDDLLSNLLNISIENAGAERGCIILDRNGELCIEAQAQSGHMPEILPSISISKSDLVPESVVMYCWRTQESLVVEDALTDDRFSNDPYISNHGTLSVLCQPIEEKGKIIGLLYLDNVLMKGVFTSERLEIMQMLSSQIGISIENAMLYENLEEKVRERTNELEKQKIALQAEKDRTDQLLLNILPEETALELKQTGTSKAKSYKNATVMFCDIVGFTKLGEKMEASVLVDEIHELFSGIDDIVKQYKVEKIKTIGDAYLCASGLNEDDNVQSTRNIVNAALDIVKFLTALNKRKISEGKPGMELRIGLHTGPVVAGVVGKAKFAYDIWGDTVNLAARMESHGKPMSINISEETYQIIKDQFECEHRGKVEAKNKGLIDMYFVTGVKQLAQS